MPAGLMVSEVIRHMLARRHNPAMPRILLVNVEALSTVKKCAFWIDVTENAVNAAVASPTRSPATRRPMRNAIATVAMSNQADTARPTRWM